MNIVETVTTPSQGLTGSLDGRIVLDQGRGRIIVTDTNGIARTVQDVQGFKTYNASSQEVVRNGVMPNGDYGLTAAKPGETIQTIYA